jgi:DNA adenine methylase
MMKNVSPLRYPGGKSKTFDFWKELLKKKENVIFCELFAGGAGLSLRLLKENVVDRIHLNEKDDNIFSFWKSVLERPQELIAEINDTQITLTERKKQKKTLEDGGSFLKKGFALLFMNRTNYSGIIKAGVLGGKNPKDKKVIASRFNKRKIIEKILLIHSMRDKITLTNKDASLLLSEDASKNYIYYADPPYYEKGKILYDLFFDDNNHKTFFTVFSNTNKPVAVSYDNTPFIRNLYKGYDHKEIVLNYTIKKNAQKKESFYYNEAFYNEIILSN